LGCHQFSPSQHTERCMNRLRLALWHNGLLREVANSWVCLSAASHRQGFEGCALLTMTFESEQLSAAPRSLMTTSCSSLGRLRHHERYGCFFFSASTSRPSGQSCVPAVPPKPGEKHRQFTDQILPHLPQQHLATCRGPTAPPQFCARWCKPSCKAADKISIASWLLKANGALALSLELGERPLLYSHRL
jgi:hypothetical protein